MSTERPTSIGEKIKFYREKFGLTQEDVALHLHTSPQNIYKYEKGIIENIPLTNIVAMAELFKVAPAELAGWGNPFKPKEETAFDRDEKASLTQENDRITLTELEVQLVMKYRKNTQLHNKIHHLLGIDPEKFNSTDAIAYQKTSDIQSKKSDTLKVASPFASRHSQK